MFQRFYQVSRLLRVEFVSRQFLGVLVLHAPDAAKMMVAVGPRGGVVRAVRGAARVVVDGGLVVIVHDVQRAVGPDAGVNRPEPKVSARDKLGFLAARLFAGYRAQ